jgi:hypothetical protein
VRKGRVRDAVLITVAHIERVDAGEVREGHGM